MSNLFAKFLLRERKHSQRFIDVDLRSRELQTARGQILDLEKQVRQLRKEINKSESKKFGLPFSESKITVDLQRPFASHFNNITSDLLDKAGRADQKASMLLDKGVLYARFGIGFYVVTILAWQILAWVSGFKIQFIYGVASCSLLFVFIEFFSAWFLRQYRQFVDTSTYLTKVKSMFDKYMLLYYLANDADAHGERNQQTVSALTEVLKSDINWPDSYLMKNADIGFAKDAMNGFTKFVKAITELKLSEPKPDK